MRCLSCWSSPASPSLHLLPCCPSSCSCSTTAFAALRPWSFFSIPLSGFELWASGCGCCRNDVGAAAAAQGLSPRINVLHVPISCHEHPSLLACDVVLRWLHSSAPLMLALCRAFVFRDCRSPMCMSVR